MPMFPKAEQSATFKQILKKRPVTDQLRRMAERHPMEASESIEECEDRSDFCTSDSWVAWAACESGYTVNVREN